MKPETLELKLPPLLVLALGLILAEALARYWPNPLPLAFSRELGIALLAAGAGLAIAGVLAFRRAQTTVDPRVPERTACIVDQGIYARTRNPMYVGMALALAGYCVWRGETTALLSLPLFAGYLTRFQIIPEERLLAARFGAPYLDYCRRVRRWL